MFFIFLIFLLFVHITRLFYREVRFIYKGHVGVLCYYTICSRHDIAEIRLKLALNTNQSINQSYLLPYISSYFQSKSSY
jgi:hypothetical protein